MRVNTYEFQFQGRAYMLQGILRRALYHEGLYSRSQCERSYAKHSITRVNMNFNSEWSHMLQGNLRRALKNEGLYSGGQNARAQYNEG